MLSALNQKDKDFSVTIWLCDRQKRNPMSDLDHLQEDVISLPKELQQTVIDFVMFLKQQQQARQNKLPQPITFDDQPFVGMWSDRPQMEDSVDWVRQTRIQQWQRQVLLRKIVSR